MGIGTNIPTAQFHTTGSLRFSGLSNSSFDRILVSDNLGNIAYRDGYFDDWHITGNSGTNPGFNFLGTIDDIKLCFRTFNQNRINIYTEGSTRFFNNNYTNLVITSNNLYNPDNCAIDLIKNNGSDIQVGSRPIASARIEFDGFGNQDYNEAMIRF